MNEHVGVNLVTPCSDTCGPKLLSFPDIYLKWNPSDANVALFESFGSWACCNSDHCCVLGYVQNKRMRGKTGQVDLSKMNYISLHL